MLRPKFFVMENVEGLLHEGKIGILNAALETLAPRYTVLNPIVINAADFGAATNRFRVVVIGFDADEIDPLDMMEIKSIRGDRITIRDAISDLPGPCSESRDRQDMVWAKYPEIARSRLSPYARALRTLPPPGLGSAEAVEQLKSGYVSGLAQTRHSPEIARRYAMIVGGKSDPITKSYKLTWDGLSPTLRAGTGAEKGAFQAVRPLHPVRGRVITVREAARIQGFPDWFLFHPTKWHSFRMIGNSVSPIVSRGLFDHIRDKLQLPLAA
jgi:DNA (cytosine-5)-methyltransferase 1